MIEHVCTDGMFMCEFDLVFGIGCGIIAVLAAA